jgi:hypothetical protein
MVSLEYLFLFFKKLEWFPVPSDYSIRRFTNRSDRRLGLRQLDLSSHFTYQQRDNQCSYGDVGDADDDSRVSDQPEVGLQDRVRRIDGAIMHHD